MKILIVDDELLVRIGLKSSIDWAKHSMEIVGEASNGKEALAMIKQEKPDVILLDIKMPVMNGIELLQKMKERNHTCKTVILSSFDDLEHVKEAMKLGAVDYLHKPCMSPEAILNILMNINKEIEKENKYPKELITAPESAGKYIFLKKLLDGQIHNDTEFYNQCAKYHIGLGHFNYSCMAFSIIDYYTIQKRYTAKNRSLLDNSVLDILCQVFTNEKNIVFYQYDKNLYIAIISMEDMVSGKKIYDKHHWIVHLITDSLKKFLDIRIGIGISRTYPSYTDIHHAFQEAFKALQQRFYSPLENVIFYHTVPTSLDAKKTLDKITNLVEELKEYLADRNYYQSNRIIENVFSLLKMQPCFSVEEVIKLFTGILFLINALNTCFEEMELISRCETLEELHHLY